MTPPTKRSPLHSVTESLGAQYSEQAGWLVPQDFGDGVAETAALRSAAGLIDASARGKLFIEGEQATQVMQELWATPNMAIGAGAVISTGTLFRLRLDLHLLFTEPGAEIEAMQALEAAKTEHLLTVTDRTHGQAMLLLVGPASREVLSRLCGLDLHPSAFPNLSTQTSSVAKTRQIIIRQDVGDLPVFALIGAGSLAAYLWKTILVAGRDLGLIPVGQAALIG